MIFFNANSENLANDAKKTLKLCVFCPVRAFRVKKLTVSKGKIIFKLKTQLSSPLKKSLQGLDILD